ncbi:ribonuclease J [Marinospirillum perlucidum]|uniref:ribonuclease J n=1 Tax=Marinospirillum perlucidum TaxID=1982602 RepID=UPI000DF41C12|nr:ribonuclease J [Marinospirillum perlucidum]
MPKPSPSLLHQQIGPFFVSLGGTGEIGANLYLYGCHGYWIAVDCGQGFRPTSTGETQSVVPDLRALEDNGIKIQALLITHGHEDHIGALPWLWQQLNCPLYTTPFTAGLISRKIPGNNSRQRKIHIIEPLQSYSFGPFTGEWVPVTHSIPEAQGIYLKAGGRRIYHTGDWKLDPHPLVGRITATERLQAIGKEGVDIVVGDSTNAPKSGWNASEKTVRQGLLNCIAKLPNRVVVTCFASNVARLSSLGYVAKATGRNLIIAGRSMQRIHQLARQQDYLPDFPTPVPLQDAGYLPRDKQLLVCTGSQGEPQAFLAKLAQDRTHQMNLEAGDHVVFSSKTIPGNEKAVLRLTRYLEHKQLQILTADSHPELHASGHPGQEEIKQLYAWLKPKHLLAMHGEEYHQQAHCDLAQQLDINARLPAEGEIYDLSATPRLAAEIYSGRLLVQGEDLVPWGG